MVEKQNDGFSLIELLIVVAIIGIIVGSVGIVANLWMKPRYRDIALRDVGLAVGALALARMAGDFGSSPLRAATR